MSFPSSIMTPLQGEQNINVHILPKHIWKFYLNPRNCLSYEQKKPWAWYFTVFFQVFAFCLSDFPWCISYFCFSVFIYRWGFFVSFFSHRKVSQMLFAALDKIPSGLKTDYYKRMLFQCLSNGRRKKWWYWTPFIKAPLRCLDVVGRI